MPGRSQSRRRLTVLTVGLGLLLALLCWRLIFYTAGIAIGGLGGQSAPDVAPISKLADAAHLHQFGSVDRQDHQDDVGPFTTVTYEAPRGCSVLYPAAQSLGYTSDKGLTADTCASASYPADVFTTPSGVRVRADWVAGRVDLTIGER